MSDTIKALTEAVQGSVITPSEPLLIQTSTTIVLSTKPCATASPARVLAEALL
jgi:hypothetical protein